jgi:hypothetical protein
LLRRSITAIVVVVVVVVVVMMVVMPMSGHHDDPWHIAAIRVMMVMMVMVLRQLHIPVAGFSLWLFIDRLQKRCRVRDRFE